MIITVINQKGGTGKTTTAAAMLAYYSRENVKALGVDLDPQCNLSLALGAQRSGANALGIMTGQANPSTAIQRANYTDVIAGAPELSAADEMFSKDIGKPYKLREALSQISGYEHIIIDAPPALGVLSVNALTAADYVVIPCQADAFSVQGLSQLADTIEQVKKYTNPQLKILGILLTRHNQRATLSRDMREVLEREAEKLQTVVFDTAIRESVTAKEPIALQESIFKDPTTNAATDYAAFMEELAKQIGG